MKLTDILYAGALALLLLGISALDAHAADTACTTSPPVPHGGNWDANEPFPPEWVPIIPDQTEALKTLTEAKIKALIKHKPKSFALLKKIEERSTLPEGTLRTKWLIESLAGERNIRNKAGYEGNFQVGDYEAKRYKIKNRKNLKDSALGVVRLLKHYSELSDIPLDSVWDAYNLHQQGFTGAAMMRKAVHTNYLRADVKRNMLNNIPKHIKKTFYNAKGELKLTDAELSTEFITVWSTEVNRINQIVLSTPN